MSGLKVGRAFGINAIEGVPSVSVAQGGRVNISGRFKEPSSRTADDLTSRFAAYVDGSDETFIPVLWPNGPSWLPGFYRCQDGSGTARARLQVRGVGEFDLTLERVQNFTAPLFESVLLGASRAGVGTVPMPFHALPASVKGYETGVLTPATAIRQSETGDVVVFTTGEFDFYDARPQYFVEPSQWYAGAATVSVNGAVVVGRQVMNAPEGWMLSNGLIRLVGEPGGWFRTEMWDGTDWTNKGDWAPVRRVGTGLGATYPSLDAPHTLTVMRNTPASVAVRLTADAASVVPGSRFAVTIDIELRRGALAADMLLTARGTYAWGVLTPLEYATQTALLDGSSQGGFVVGALGDTSSFADPDGRAVHAITSGTRLNVGIGYHRDSGIDTAQSVINQWAAVQSENVTVAAR